MHTFESNEEKTNIADQHVFALIINKVFEEVNSEKDLNVLAEHFAEHFNQLASEFILNASQKDVYKILFLSGYFYKVFLNKNNAIFVKESN